MEEAPVNIPTGPQTDLATGFKGICFICHSASGKTCKSLCRATRKHTECDWWVQVYPVGARVLLRTSQQVNYVLGYEFSYDNKNTVNVSLCLGSNATTTHAAATKITVKHAKTTLEVQQPTGVAPPPQGDPPPPPPPPDPIHTEGSGDGVAHNSAEPLPTPTTSSPQTTPAHEAPRTTPFSPTVSSPPQPKPPGHEDPAKAPEPATPRPSSTTATEYNDLIKWGSKRKRDDYIRTRILLEMNQESPTLHHGPQGNFAAFK